MNNFYNILAESLNAKHASIINEAWSKNLPKWFTDRLSRSANNWAAKFDASSTKGEYIPTTEKTIFSSFKTGGIDFQDDSLEFVEGPIPKSGRDPRLASPNIPVWGLCTDNSGEVVQVYAKGINDLEKPYFPEPEMGPYAKLPFSRWSVKKLGEFSLKFGYIPGDSIPRRDFDKVRRTRNQRNKDRSEMVMSGNERYAYEPVRRGDEQTYLNLKDSMGDTFLAATDKSGYIVIPSARKYAKQLSLKGLKNYATEIQDLHDRLEKIYIDFRYSQLSIPFNNYSSYNSSMGSISIRLENAFVSAINRYNLLIQILDRVSLQYSEGSNELLKELDEERFPKYLKDCKKYTKQAEEILPEINNDGVYTSLDF